jgi:uncharacterized protein YcaQ
LRNAPQMLDRLQAEDRSVFEYWGHAASYLPMSDYRFYMPRMHSLRNPQNKWVRRIWEKHGHLLKPLLERVQKEGPLSARDLASSSEAKRGPWWGWTSGKAALELLFWQGDLMVTARRNFERVYDLTERVLPNGIDTRMPDSDELGRFLVRRALSAYGIAREREIHNHIPAADKAVMHAALQELLESGEVVPVCFADEARADYFALSSMMEISSKTRRHSRRLHILSPFDNLIIQRDRMKRLFDFDYTIECYVPAAKRRYGYFVLPILWQGELIGRLDPKADRAQRVLIIRKLFLEREPKNRDIFLASLATKLREFAAFNDCDEIKIEKTAPGTLKRELKTLL